MIEGNKNTAFYRALAILAFAGSGVTSTFLFYRITDLSLLQGLRHDLLMLMLACAWVTIFPLWVLLYVLAMMFVDTMTRRY